MSLKYRIFVILALIAASVWALFPRTVVERVKRNGEFVYDTVRRVPLTRGLDLHPTVKPIAMVADAILDVTERGDVVLDPFGGSGTAILADERAGRRGDVIELDPGHVDTAIARWQRMTKHTAVHANGKTFDEIRAERQLVDGGT